MSVIFLFFLESWRTGKKIYMLNHRCIFAYYGQSPFPHRVYQLIQETYNIETKCSCWSCSQTVVREVCGGREAVFVWGWKTSRIGLHVLPGGGDVVESRGILGGERSLRRAAANETSAIQSFEMSSSRVCAWNGC